jgi:hypothetical protein
MRLRSVVLPVAVAVAAAIAVPATANAAAVQCGVIMPTKVVINAKTVDTDMTLTSGCFTNHADHANWTYTNTRAGFGAPLTWTAEELAQGSDWYTTWDDWQPMGTYYLVPDECKTAGGVDLTQNSAVTKVKYGSKLATKVTRSGTKLTWIATATQWSGQLHKNIARRAVTVGLFHKAPGSTTWKYVKAAKTSSTGKVTVSLATPKTGSYRLAVAETPTVWAAYSSAVRGRI